MPFSTKQSQMIFDDIPDYCSCFLISGTNIWDPATHTKIWAAKSTPKNSLDIYIPTWFTSVTFLHKDDHIKFVAGTNNHRVIHKMVCLYDMFAQRTCHVI